MFWIVEGKLAGRAGPKFAPWDLQELRHAGINNILSLATDLFDIEQARAVGIDKTCIPLSDVTPPDNQGIEVCRQLLPLTFQYLTEQLKFNKTVLVHCGAGFDRTGLVLSYFLTQQHKLDANSAIARVRQLQPKALSAPGWESMAKQLFSEVTPPANFGEEVSR